MDNSIAVDRVIDRSCLFVGSSIVAEYYLVGSNRVPLLECYWYLQEWLVDNMKVILTMFGVLVPPVVLQVIDKTQLLIVVVVFGR